MSANEIQSKARELKELKVMKDELEAEITAIEDARFVQADVSR